MIKLKHSIRLLFVLSILFYSTLSLGQISKGDFTIDFGSGLSYNNSEPKIPFGSLNFSYLRMINDVLMIPPPRKPKIKTKKNIIANPKITGFFKY